MPGGEEAEAASGLGGCIWLSRDWLREDEETNCQILSGRHLSCRLADDASRLHSTGPVTLSVTQRAISAYASTRLSRVSFLRSSHSEHLQPQRHTEAEVRTCAMFAVRDCYIADRFHALRALVNNSLHEFASF